MSAGVKGVFGQPGYRTTQFFTHKFIFRDGTVGYWPGGGDIDTTKTRDVMAGSDNNYFLRPGTLMGKITSGGKWANSFFGVTTGAITGASTTITVSAAQAVELVRRVGSTGTFSLLGPPTSNGTVRSATVTYSAVNTTTGDITVTAIGVNEVQTITPTTAASAGTFVIRLTRPDGTIAKTGPIAYNASVATIQTALDLASGVANGIVLTTAGSAAPISTPVAMVFTFSGTGFTALPAPGTVQVDPAGLTGETLLAYVGTTAGVDGRFIAGSLVGGTDGSQSPLSFIDGGYGLTLFTDPNDAPSVNPWPQIPCFGTIEEGQLAYWPSNAPLKTYLRNLISTTSGGKFMFSGILGA